TLSQADKCNCTAVARKAAMQLMEAIPRIREVLKTDVAAAFNSDPAAKSYDEIILAYPGIQAISMHRIAHELYKAGVPLIPRIISEYAHSLTGIDIHPGATIGEYFFIDHGTGIVIGETTEIGDNVKIYMGVTLGALAPTQGQLLRNTKRHPTIEDDVTIYAGATILGGKSVIGRGSVINGNVFLTKGVPPYTTVGMSSPELHFRGNKPPQKKETPRKLKWVCPAGKTVCKGKVCKPVKKKAKKKAKRK
ncbi:MAG: hypothetical protein JXA52_07410, partial [Planctomycetes bacterium]|nr:hypothetical protein [Planctomycetota bacterium]